MRRKRQLVAGVTVTGAVLCLTLSAGANTSAPQNDLTLEAHKPLAARVEDLREKLNAGLPQFKKKPGQNRAIENIVQFFKFLNCSRPDGWHNC